MAVVFFWPYIPATFVHVIFPAMIFPDHCFYIGPLLLHGSYRFDNLLFKDFSRTFQGLLTTFKESVYTGTI